MAADAHSGTQLVQVVALLAAGVVAVPVFRRIGLGSVLGYLAAGIVIGPFGLRLFSDPQAILHIAELGVVMFLFVIGLEMQPSRLWSLRREIFGLGVAQVAFCTLLLAGTGMLWGLSPLVAFFAAAGFVLTSTATVMQLLDERREVSSPRGQRIVSILLLEDLAIVPLLIAVTLLTPGAAKLSAGEFWQAIGIAGASLAVLVAAGRWLLNPFFRFLAESRAREVMTAAALLVVLGAALGMHLGGLSMAMGAFLAGVLLSESTFRHQLEADIEPFRGILLGLFFLAVGMSLDLALMARQWPLILAGTLSFMLVKAAGIYAIARIRSKHGEGLYRAAMMAQGGEFAFVLFQYAFGLHILPAGDAAFLTLAVALSMAATPLIMMLNDVYLVPMFMSRLPDPQFDSVPADRHSPVIIAGYGRFGQVVGRFLRAQGVEPTILEKDPDQIELLRKFGSRGYFGDASRPELLRNAGAAQAAVLVIAVDDADKCLEIARMAKEEFPALKIMARARNRRHAYELYKIGADYFRRECFDSSLVMAQEVMKALGRPAADMEYRARQFMHHDEETLVKSFAFFDREPELISFSRQATGELERILQSDIEQGATTPAAAAAAHK